MDEYFRLCSQGLLSQGLIKLESLKENLKPSDYLGHRAGLLFDMGRTREAQQDYAALLAVTPDNAEVLARLSAAELALSFWEDAHAHAGAAPDHELSRQVLAALASIDRFRSHQQGTIDAAAVRGALLEERQFIDSSSEAAGELLASLVRALRPEFLVEIGAFEGFSTLSLAEALERNGRGICHSFDLFLPRAGYRSPVLGDWNREMLTVARTHLSIAGLSHRVNFHQGKSSELLNILRREELPAIDFAFIDGDHTQEGVSRDFQAVRERLRHPATIVLHDTRHRDWDGPRWLVNQLRGDRSWTVCDLPTADGAGMAIASQWEDSLKQPWG